MDIWPVVPTDTLDRLSPRRVDQGFCRSLEDGRSSWIGEVLPSPARLSCSWLLGASKRNYQRAWCEAGRTLEHPDTQQGMLRSPVRSHSLKRVLLEIRDECRWGVCCWGLSPWTVSDRLGYQVGGSACVRDDGMLRTNVSVLLVRDVVRPLKWMLGSAMGPPGCRAPAVSKPG